MLRGLLAAVVVVSGAQFGAPASAAPASIRIMPLGDSITAGAGAPGREGYRLVLQRRLERAGTAFDFVGSQRGGIGGDPDHEGHGGWTIEQLSERVGDWLDTYAPDVVLLHAGTNNITRGDDPAEVARKLSALVDLILATAPRTRIFVSTVVGTNVLSEMAANHAYNALIPAVVAGKGPRVRLVDQAPVSGLSIYDRHHPNAHGYARMAHSWYEAMRTELGPAWPDEADPDSADLVYLCHHHGSVRVCRWWQRKPAGRGSLTEREVGQRVPCVAGLRVSRDQADRGDPRPDRQ
ncbi:lysophospholipase L1-like esterase [Actinoplanes lutulentus]|uniref:Lysophospholipase L1-like esterase n=2 Tax=Actinoplanes lutulentus TaxID=1287878 RepID=A0A327Z4X5_9ACTN|nr:SGNH/GDSL hydrolase family protein [Actinoplanes lutulentus]RAK31276.1 lysophospholipase L1-like esterase [Actinoplanes lutulentus]